MDVHELEEVVRRAQRAIARAKSLTVEYGLQPNHNIEPISQEHQEASRCHDQQAGASTSSQSRVQRSPHAGFDGSDPLRIATNSTAADILVDEEPARGSEFERSAHGSMDSAIRTPVSSQTTRSRLVLRLQLSPTAHLAVLPAADNAAAPISGSPESRNGVVMMAQDSSASHPDDVESSEGMELEGVPPTLQRSAQPLVLVAHRLALLQHQQAHTLHQLLILRLEQLRLRQQQLLALQELLRSEVEAVEGTPLQTSAVHQAVGLLSQSLTDMHTAAAAIHLSMGLEHVAVVAERVSRADGRAEEVSRMARQLLSVLREFPRRQDAMLLPPNASRGATEVELSHLETAVCEEGSPMLLDCCSICLSEYQVGDALACTGCLHFHHAVCLREWLRVRMCCPLCKHVYKEEAEETSSGATVSGHEQDIGRSDMGLAAAVMDNSIEGAGERIGAALVLHSAHTSADRGAAMTLTASARGGEPSMVGWERMPSAGAALAAGTASTHLTGQTSMPGGVAPEVCDAGGLLAAEHLPGNPAFSYAAGHGANVSVLTAARDPCSYVVEVYGQRALSAGSRSRHPECEGAAALLMSGLVDDGGHVSTAQGDR